jgi:hypothetical protein
MKLFLLSTFYSLLSISCPACTYVDFTFEGYKSDQVWKAMVVAAETPTYDDWHVAENNVWVDKTEYRIEIYRRLRRVLHRPGAEPQREEQTWSFDVRMIGLDPPKARLVSRQSAVPMHATREGQRYFLDVHDLLLGVAGEAVLKDADDAVLQSLGTDEEPPPSEDVEFLGPP